MQKMYVSLLLMCIVVLAVSGRFLLPKSAVEITESSADNPNTIVATESAMPFEEMTIPYLRARSYESTLGDMEPAFDNLNYTVYLTSYNSDGLRVNGLLTVPTGQKPAKGWPAIVFIHGYIPPAQYQTLERYGDYVDYLARNGFVVFKIDLRGHGQSEGEPGGGYYGSDYVVDTLNAYVALERSSIVNPEAIGLWGHSMAGNIIMRSMAARPTIPAGVIWAGAVYTYVDMKEYGIQDASYQPLPRTTITQSKRAELIAKHGTPSAESPFWKLVAPTNYLADIQGAINIHHAVDDPVVSVEYSRNLTSLLDKTPVPHRLYEYQSGGHNISDPSFSQAMGRTVNFFKEELK